MGSLGSQFLSGKIVNVLLDEALFFTQLKHGRTFLARKARECCFKRPKIQWSNYLMIKVSRQPEFNIEMGWRKGAPTKKPIISDGLLISAFAEANKILGNVLLSHTVTHAVPSALKGLTSVFGMGTGVSPPPWSPRNLNPNSKH